MTGRRPSTFAARLLLTFLLLVEEAAAMKRMLFADSATGFPKDSDDGQDHLR
jgi:hypothetical protein